MTPRDRAFAAWTWVFRVGFGLILCALLPLTILRGAAELFVRAVDWLDEGIWRWARGVRQRRARQIIASHPEVAP